VRPITDVTKPLEKKKWWYAIHKLFRKHHLKKKTQKQKQTNKKNFIMAIY
jgi:hypothetical protein